PANRSGKASRADRRRRGVSPRSPRAAWSRPAMRWLSDNAVDRLREEADLPDLGGSKYLVLNKLGSGGMGTVYLAQDVDLGRKVAVKVMNLADSAGALASRMMREARIVAMLEHPSIVPIHDVGALEDGRIFYAMKLVRGARLDQST